jgi:hypothetical protein
VKFLLVFFAVLAFAATTAFPQKLSPFAQYMADSESILVVKCIASGPVDILLRSIVEVEILHVVKGEKPTKLSFKSRYGMEPGGYYLMRFARGHDKKQVRRNEDSVIPIVSKHEAEGLNAFSPEIAVLRTMNLRIYRLESELQSITFELESLKKAKIDD